MTAYERTTLTLQHRFGRLSLAGIDLMRRLLTMDPARRITAREALLHPFFSESPLPKPPGLMPTFAPTNGERYDERRKSTPSAPVHPGY